MTGAVFGLIGVAIGGIIGVVSTYLQQRFAHKRWKTEATVEYLQGLRRRREEAYGYFLQELQKNGWTSADTRAKAMVLMALHVPPELCEKLAKADVDFVNKGQFSEADLNQWVVKQGHILRSDLQDLEKEIQSLLSNC